MHDGSTVAGLFTPRLLLWLRQRGLDVVLVIVEVKDEGLLGVAARLSQLSDLRIRWYAFLIESSRTPESLRRLLRADFLTGAKTRNMCV